MLSVLLILMPVTLDAQADPTWTLKSVFKAASVTTGAPENLLRAVCWVESNHRPKARKVWDNGAPSYGMCQVKLQTARTVGFTGSADQLQHPMVNAYVAGLLLKKYLDRADGDWRKAVTFYNRGPNTKTTRYNNTYVIKVSLALKEGR